MQSFLGSIIARIITAGLAVAAIDAVYFSAGAIAKGNSPVRVLQSIAGFWMGKAAATSGALGALLGAATHIGLAILMAAAFLPAAKVLPLFRAAPPIGGAAYGLLLYCIMYLIVLPLRWPAIFPRWAGWESVLDIGVHIVIGVTIAALLRPALVQHPAPALAA
jgi:uncharacterized membrane protein YagU involved in acid resistance